MPDYTILVIDYEPPAIEKIKLYLGKLGYRIEVASNGVTGIEAFHDLEPVMVLVEQLLPRKTGMETCQEIKNTPSGANIPIVVMGSRFGGRKLRNTAIDNYGANEFITKPVNEEELLSVMAKLRVPSPAPPQKTATAAKVAPATAPAIAPAPATASAPATTPAPATAPAPSEKESPAAAKPDDSVESEIADRLDSLFADS
mgnify:CR=1 FL=1